MSIKTIHITKGKDLPIIGAPVQSISAGNPVTTAALLGEDYPGLKPSFTVHVGDRVKEGQVLFTDRKMEGVVYTSPAAGTVTAIHRGEKRRFLSIVITIDGDDHVSFPSYPAANLANLDPQAVKDQLISSGLWTALRRRPFARTIPVSAPAPEAIFITAMDTRPLAPDVTEIVKGQETDLANGLAVLSRLTEGKLHLCVAPGCPISLPNIPRLEVTAFDGPHPAGLPGTHIEHLHRVGRKTSVWHIETQDVIAIGKLFTTGRLSFDRVISLAGAGVKNPRLIKTRMGASIADLIKNETADGALRTISGSVLYGYALSETAAHLGRFHQQITVIPEGTRRRTMGWATPGFDIYSVFRVFAGSLSSKLRSFDTLVNGSRRIILTIGLYEKVLPFDTEAAFLMKALATGDLEEAEQLGALGMDEEDLSLCTFVCPSKEDYGPMLRKILKAVEEEG